MTPHEQSQHIWPSNCNYGNCLIDPVLVYSLPPESTQFNWWLKADMIRDYHFCILHVARISATPGNIIFGRLFWLRDGWVTSEVSAWPSALWYLLQHRPRTQCEGGINCQICRSNYTFGECGEDCWVCGPSGSTDRWTLSRILFIIWPPDDSIPKRGHDNASVFQLSVLIQNLFPTVLKMSEYSIFLSVQLPE